MHQYVQVGWREEAIAMADQVLQLQPKNPEALQVKAAYASKNSAISHGKASESKIQSKPRIRSQLKRTSKGKYNAIRPPQSDIERDEMEDNFTTGIKQIRHIAADFHEDLVVVSKLLEQYETTDFWKERTASVLALSEGRFNAVIDGGAPCSVRELCRMIEAQPDEAIDLAADDFVNIVTWFRQEDDAVDLGAVRDRLVRRVRALSAALPEDLQFVAEQGLMHAEHEGLGKTYVNDETMLGDSILDIPRSRFWVSSDNYAWDMEELVNCLTARSGVMRNPLSLEMFNAEDVETIVTHPLGITLGAAQVEQEKLANGVRLSTIKAMETLSAALLADQTADQAPTRLALDVFKQYTATLPKAERDGLDKLQVPAVDSHTGQKFDSSIGETIRDAIGNKTCAHKAGDFLGQAARHLKRTDRNASGSI